MNTNVHLLPLYIFSQSKSWSGGNESERKRSVTKVTNLTLCEPCEGFPLRARAPLLFPSPRRKPLSRSVAPYFVAPYRNLCPQADPTPSSTFYYPPSLSLAAVVQISCSSALGIFDLPLPPLAPLRLLPWTSNDSALPPSNTSRWLSKSRRLTRSSTSSRTPRPRVRLLFLALPFFSPLLCSRCHERC
jgi:hypothetical protein